MATWGKHKQCTCEVKHVAAVLEWAVEGYCGINVLGPEQRAELAEAVQKTACDLMRKELTCMTGSIGADIDGVDAEVRRLHADLESAKEELQRTHTELAAVQAEANRFSLALTGVKQDLEREGSTCKTLGQKSRSCAGSLKPQLVASQECNVAEGCNAMSQQNLEEEPGCGQTDCRKMKKQAMAKRTADKEAGNDQATGLQKKPSRFCCRRRTHTAMT
jgi:hypothetical protein